jgi:(p)ppGpp synthase/HD superfamily hydrolase
MTELTLIQQALMFAQLAHRNQKDDEGQPYINHPHQVAEIIKLITKDEELIASAYLHDVVEDCKVKPDELEMFFGKRVADLVMEVTHEGKKAEGHYFPRLKSRDAILLKFADRLSNLSRMNTWDEGRKEHYLKKSRFWKQAEGELTIGQLIRKNKELEAEIKKLKKGK